jgi:hypothetical protein
MLHNIPEEQGPPQLHVVCVVLESDLYLDIHHHENLNSQKITF